MDEILLIDKPSGWTSFDVVAKIRGKLQKAAGKKVKVGHAGTLDPLATGLLLILVGKATKRADEFLKLDKVYEVTLKLGYTSTTGDEEGEKTAVSHIEPSKSEVINAAKKFVGEIDQVPPAFSAIKLDGRRSYDLARAGKSVEHKPRKVTIYTIDDIEYAYPYMSFTTKVSSGTYIRTLAEDIGQVLETGAYTTKLRRTMVGEFSITDATPVPGTN